MQKSTVFLANVLGVATLVSLTQGLASAKTASEVKQIATVVTVKIITDNPDRPGSGIIAERQGNLYTIVTNAHVICQKNWNNTCSPYSKYTVVTSDNQQHQVSAEAVKKVPGDLDLAVIKIRSSKLYSIAQFANSSQVKNQDVIYAAGFPGNTSRLKFEGGKVIANVSHRMKGDNGGYTMLYDAATLPGMSGSALFDSQGRVVAIHGQGDLYKPGTDINNNYNRIGQKIGVNRGIPANRLKLTSNTSNSGNDDRQIEPSTADGFLIASYNKFLEPNLNNIKSSKIAAIKLASRVIFLQPNYLHAYILRGWIYSQLGQNQKALSDCNLAVNIDTKYSNSYVTRGSVKFYLGDRKGALEDFNHAIQLNPSNTIALESRATISSMLGDGKKAVIDLDRAIAISPGNMSSYITRCGANAIARNIKDATKDCSRAISIYDGLKARSELLDESYPIHIAYSSLGAIEYAFKGNNEKALEYLNTAINLYQSDANYYIYRGTVKRSMRDTQGALTDFYSALNMNSTSINMYLGFAMTYEQTGYNKQEAAIYYQKALDVSRENGGILDRGLLENGGLVNQAILMFKVIELNGKPIDSPNAPQKGWIEQTIEQGILDLFGKPR
jgi:tetratricopeptide (TPR) repeat protein